MSDSNINHDTRTVQLNHGKMYVESMTYTVGFPDVVVSGYPFFMPYEQAVDIAKALDEVDMVVTTHHFMDGRLEDPRRTKIESVSLVKRMHP